MSDFAFLGCGIVLTGLFAVAADLRLQENVNQLGQKLKELRDRVERLEADHAK